MKENTVSIKFRALFMGCLLASSLYAIDVIEQDGNKNTSNEIDDTYQEQKGWSFYQDYKKLDVNNSKKTSLKKIEFDLLQKILDENRKQTKIQKKILALLQKQIDPKPKEITVNGKKCIANSSAKCFDFGSLLIAEAKKVPVMVEWLKDPYDVTKAAKYLQWQAKYFKHVFNVGNSLQFAYAQFGDKAYPIGAQTSSYVVGGGSYEGKMLPEAEKNLILSMKDKISYSIFIGKNIIMDIYSALNVIDILKEYKGLNIDFVFWDKKSKITFTESLAAVYKIEKLDVWKNVKKEVNKEKFKTFGVTTTPSYVIKLNNKGKKEAQILLHGRVDVTSFRRRTISYLELKKLINYKTFTQQNNWENSNSSKNITRKLYKDRFGVKIKIPTIRVEK